MSEQNEWYSNKALYEMMVDLSKRLEHTNAELEKTQVLIRDYNGLRQKINDCEQLLHETKGKAAGGRDVYGYVVGAIGLIMALISSTVK